MRKCLQRPRNNSSPSYLISSALIGRSCMWTHKAMMVNMLNTTCTKVSMFALSLWACHRAHISIYFKALLCTGSQSCSRGCRLFVLLCVWEISWLLASWLSLRLSWEIFLSNISVCCLEGIVPLSIFLFFLWTEAVFQDDVEMVQGSAKLNLYLGAFFVGFSKGTPSISLVSEIKADNVRVSLSDFLRLSWLLFKIPHK